MSRRLQRNTEAAISVYYNEFDPFAAAWLRALIDAGELPAGDVDERSITEVKADELRGYSQCHFFAGIGGWPLALRWAGVPTDEPIWTGSCPCQPFSAAGKRKGTADERHLWPVFGRLIADARPPVVFGEQVASKDGRLWLSGVRTDMEALGYAFGAADLCAAGAGAEAVEILEEWEDEATGEVEVFSDRRTAGAPHARQRLWWVGELADHNNSRWPTWHGTAAPDRHWHTTFANGRAAGVLSDAGQPSSRGDSRCRCGDAAACCESCQRRRGAAVQPAGLCSSGVVEQSAGDGRCGWSDFDILPFRDDKARRVESGSFPLVDGIPRGLGRGESRERRVAIRTARANRNGQLKGYGNAIVPQVAAEFIKAFLETRQ